jgi:hypothetical protein
LSVTCGRSVGFSGYPVLSTNKTDRHDIHEILFKVALNTINPKNQTRTKITLHIWSTKKVWRCVPSILMQQLTANSSYNEVVNLNSNWVTPVHSVGVVPWHYVKWFSFHWWLKCIRHFLKLQISCRFVRTINATTITNLFLYQLLIKLLQI